MPGGARIALPSHVQIVAVRCGAEDRREVARADVETRGNGCHDDGHAAQGCLRTRLEHEALQSSRFAVRAADSMPWFSKCFGPFTVVVFCALCKVTKLATVLLIHRSINSDEAVLPLLYSIWLQQIISMRK